MFFFFKQKTAYELRISDWSSDVCSSDLAAERLHLVLDHGGHFRWLYPPQMRQWKAQDAIGQLEAQPPQQPLPQATLAGVDHQLEDAVDQDQSQEAEAERQQHVRLCQVDAVEQAHGMAEQRLAEGQVEREEDRKSKTSEL